MQSNHTTSNNIQKDELAKAFIKLIEKVSNVKILDTQSCSGFTLNIKPYSDCTKADTITQIELTETQLNHLVTELQQLITA